MPIYDYKCAECGTGYDIFHKSHEIVEDVRCPACGSEKHKRLISAPNISMSARSSSEISTGPACENGGCCGGACGLD